MLIPRNSATLLRCARVIALTLASGASAATLRVVTTVALPEGVIARDARWAGAEAAYVSTGKHGVARVALNGPPQNTTVMHGGDQGGFPVVGLLAVGQKDLLVASRLGALGWMPIRAAAPKIGTKGMLTVMDIDARGDTAAVLGADSGPLQGLEREGTIAWIGSLSKDLADMHPLMRGRSHPGGKDMARCGMLEIGAIRFMQDGSLVVLPGTEPGVYRYSRDGKLLRTWDTGPLAIVDDCSIEDE